MDLSPPAYSCRVLRVPVPALIGSSGDIQLSFGILDANGDASSIEVQYQGGTVGSAWTTASTSGYRGDILTYNNSIDVR